jgi:hypothetical protein
MTDKEKLRKPLIVIMIGIVVFMIGYSYYYYSKMAKVDSTVHIEVDKDTGIILSASVKGEIQPGVTLLYTSTLPFVLNQISPNLAEDDPAPVNEKFYVAETGVKNEGIEERINQQVNRKFFHHPPIEIPAVPGQKVAFSYLFRRLEIAGFVPAKGEFKNLSVRVLKLKEGSVVDARIFYAHENNFVIELPVGDDENIVFARIPPDSTIENTILEVERRIASGNQVALNESFSIPELDFDLRKVFPSDAFTNGEGLYVQQRIKFMITGENNLPAEGSVSNKSRFNFSDEFLIYLKRKDAEKPYSFIWIGNDKLLKKT